MKEFNGNLDSKSKKWAIIVSRTNSFISEKLCEGAVDCLIRHGSEDSDIDLIKIPGAFEMPLTVKLLAEKNRYNGIICLGAVIRGATPHFDFIAAEAAKGIAQASMEAKVPAAFGILTTESVEQAIERAGTKAGNKGWDAALCAIEMANLIDGF